MGIKETLLSFMKEEAYRPMDIQELVAVFDINPDEYKAFKRALIVMELEGSIVRTKKDKFAVPERLGLIKGKLQAHKKGFGFLIPEEEGERDVFIPSSFINGAMNNDRVLVQITRDDINGKKREGEVVEVLERATSRDEYKAFKRALKVMELEGTIVRTKKDKFAVPERLGLIKGKLQAHKKGFGFLIPEEKGERDVFIPSSFINGAMNNDRVLVQITRDDINGKKREGEVVEVLERANSRIIGVYEDSRNFGFVVPEDTRLNQDIFVSKKDKNGAKHGDVVIVEVTKWPKKREGEVVEVLERANSRIIGVYEDSRNFGFVVPEDTRLNQDIFVSKKDKNGAKHGDVVIVEVTKWPEKRRSPEGIVKEFLGKKGEKGLDILTIIKKHGLPEEFPPKVLAYADGISESRRNS